MSEVNEIVGSPGDGNVAIVWADGSYTTTDGTFVGGSEEAKLSVAVAKIREIEKRQRFAQSHLSSRDQYHLAADHSEAIENLLLTIEKGLGLYVE